MKQQFAIHNLDGDSIELFLSSDTYYGEYKNPYLTVYKSQLDNKIIGAEINNFTKLSGEDMHLGKLLCKEQLAEKEICEYLLLQVQKYKIKIETIYD